jgi:hypothetical protein
MEPVRRNTLGYEVSTRANVTSEIAMLFECVPSAMRLEW